MQLKTISVRTLSALLSVLVVACGAVDSHRDAVTTDPTEKHLQNVKLNKRFDLYSFVAQAQAKAIADLNARLAQPLYEGWVFDGKRGTPWADTSVPTILSVPKVDPKQVDERQKKRHKEAVNATKANHYVTDRTDPDLRTYSWKPTVTMKKRAPNRKCQDLPNMLIIEGPNFCAYTPGIRRKHRVKPCPPIAGHTLVDVRGGCTYAKGEKMASDKKNTLVFPQSCLTFHDYAFDGWAFDGKRGHPGKTCTIPKIFHGLDPSRIQFEGHTLAERAQFYEYVTNSTHADLKTYYWDPVTVKMEPRIYRRPFEKYPDTSDCPAGYETQEFSKDSKYPFKHCWGNCPAGYVVHQKPEGDGAVWTCIKDKCPERKNMLLAEGPNFCAYTAGVKQVKTGNKCPEKPGYTLVDDNGVCAWTRDVTY